MPAKDIYHDAVVHALTKANWIVAQEQVHFLVGKRHLWIDIFALRFADNSPIFVEIKSFENVRSPIDYMYAALGKYGMYKGILEERNRNIPLYMAVPETAAQGIFQEKFGKIASKYFDIQLIVFDPIREELIRWIP